MLIWAFQHIDKCKQLFQVPIFWGPFEIESFINPKKLLMELHWTFLNPRKTIQPEVSFKIMDPMTLVVNQKIELDQNFSP